MYDFNLQKRNGAEKKKADFLLIIIRTISVLKKIIRVFRFSNGTLPRKKKRNEVVLTWFQSNGSKEIIRGKNFINIMHATFLHELVIKSFTVSHHFWQKYVIEKVVFKKLLNLTGFSNSIDSSNSKCLNYRIMQRIWM